MPIQYSAALDTFVNPVAGQTQNSPNHLDQHANANDAIEALQTKVGVTDSAVVTSHHYRIRQLEASSGHAHVSGETPAGTVTATSKGLDDRL